MKQFLAHFTSLAGDNDYSHFTLLVSATNVESAKEKLRLKLKNLKLSDDMFKEITHIDLEYLAQINRFPEEAVLTQHVNASFSDNSFSTISNQNSSPDHFVTFDVENDNETTLFLSFDEQGSVYCTVK